MREGNHLGGRNESSGFDQLGRYDRGWAGFEALLVDEEADLLPLCPELVFLSTHFKSDAASNFLVF